MTFLYLVRKFILDHRKSYLTKKQQLWRPNFMSCETISMTTRQLLDCGRSNAQPSESLAFFSPNGECFASPWHLFYKDIEKMCCFRQLFDILPWRSTGQEFLWVWWSLFFHLVSPSGHLKKKKCQIFWFWFMTKYFQTTFQPAIVPSKC